MELVGMNGKGICRNGYGVDGVKQRIMVLLTMERERESERLGVVIIWLLYGVVGCMSSGMMGGGNDDFHNSGDSSNAGE